MYEIEFKELPNLNKEIVIDKISGIVLHSSPELFNKTIDEINEIVIAKNKESENIGFHYIIDGKKIYKLSEETTVIRSLNHKPTFISKSLFGDTVNESILSICVAIHENQSYEETEQTLYWLLKDILNRFDDLYSYDIWRGFDLDKSNVGPFHFLSKEIFEIFINELKKYKEDPEEQVTPEEGMDGNTLNNNLKSKAINPDAILLSPFIKIAEEKKVTINDYVFSLFKNNLDDPRSYAARFQPWNKGLKNAQTETTLEGELTTKTLNSQNTLQYKITENAAMNLDHCEQPVDYIEAINSSVDTMVEPIYPDLIVPPGDNVHIADGFSETQVQSENNTPLTAEELERRQKKFDFSQFENIKKETKGRPINTEDPFPVDSQISKLQEHYPKVKIDKVKFDLKDSNHPNSEIGNAMLSNLNMTYDMISEIAKKTEQRLVKIENNLSTVMRNLHRTASRININCVYYGGQSIYNKYKCIRCLQDDRINDGDLVTLDQCLNCTRYEPVLGQVYAILDETGENIVQVMDDLQMSYTGLREYNELTSLDEYYSPKLNAKVDNHNPTIPEPFVNNKWKDTDEEIKIKIEQMNKENENNKNKEQDEVDEDNDKKEEDIIDLADKVKDMKNGFKMNWNPTKLETQRPHINAYEIEDLTADKKAIESNREEIDRNIFIDSREDALEYERIEYDIKDYEISEFGNKAVNGSGNGMAAETRKKITDYALNAVKLCESGKARYSQPYRYNHLDKAMNGISYWDCSSLVQRAYENAEISGIGTYTGNQYPNCLDATGGLVIPLQNMSEAMPGDMIWFTKYDKPNTKEGLQTVKPSTIHHVGIYLGDGKYAHSSYPHSDPTKDINVSEVKNNKDAFCFGRPKALIDLDKQFGQGVAGNSHWSREFHGISDDWWNKAAVADSNVKSFVSNMEKYNYKDLIISISQQKNFDPYLTAALIAVESSGDPRDNDKYAGLMQVEGHYGSTSRDGMADNIDKGIAMILRKKTYLKQKGWQEENVHVLVSAYNSGEGTVGGASSAHSVNLATCKIPELGEALYKYVKSKNPSWNPIEKQTYAVKVLRAYNLIYSNNYLGLPQDNPATYTGDFIAPVPHRISSKYGPRIHPITGVAGTMHHGIDYATPMGFDIKASRSGKVIVAGKQNGYGNVVYLEHDDGYTTRYAHMSSISVRINVQVKQGDVVGKCGSTGDSTGPHLHFEIRKNGQSLDPVTLLKNY